ncbi:MAG: hypothetical protein R3A52_18920 [Polyangiales bacterium]
MKTPAALSFAALSLAALTAASEGRAQGFTNVDWLVLQPEVGVSWANVASFSNSNLFPEVNTSSETGPRYGAFVGMRFGPVSFGGHFDFARYTPYDIGTVGVMGELRLPSPLIQPWARLGIGYAWLGDVNLASNAFRCSPGSTATECPSINGWNLGLGAGVDFALIKYVTVGAGVDFTLLNLTRSASPTATGFSQTGDSVGFQLSLMARAALRF